MEVASQAADELLASLVAGADIATLAVDSGWVLVQAEAATRTGAQANTQLRDQVFLLQGPDEEGPARAVIKLDDGYAVIQLDSVTPGELAEEDALRKQMYSRRISNASASTETLGFLEMLRKQSTIQVYEDRF